MTHLFGILIGFTYY